MKKHLIKNSCSDECDVWCDVGPTVAQTHDPARATCEACLFAAEEHATAIVRRAVEARYANAHGFTLTEIETARSA